MWEREVMGELYAIPAPYTHRRRTPFANPVERQNCGFVKRAGKNALAA